MNISATSLQTGSVAPAFATARDREAGSGSSEKPEAKSEETAVSDSDLSKIRELKARDREVRAHEAAHIAAGGSAVRGGARLQYVRGPDGVLYATGGEVSIDTSKASTPEATLAKAEMIRRAALAPAKPSSQDRAIAADAARMAMQARQEISAQQQAGEENGFRSSRAISSYQSSGTLESPSESNLDELI
jgi:hypothetical protein